MIVRIFPEYRNDSLRQTYAFFRSNIKCIRLPQTLTEIGNRAFAECQQLEKLIAPESFGNIVNSNYAKELEKY